jgi:uncharacterized damage-inducible protein DinB
MRPDLNRVPAFYHNYISQVKEDDLMKAFSDQTPAFIQFLESIPASKVDYAYGVGKWTIKEVLQHIIDAERIFSYRALSFARKDETPLPSFDENLYAETSKADRRNWKDLIEEFKTVRSSSEWLFRSFDDDQLNAEGISNNHSNYVLGFGFILIGHGAHHMRIIRERYLEA